MLYGAQFACEMDFITHYASQMGSDTQFEGYDPCFAKFT